MISLAYFQKETTRLCQEVLEKRGHMKFPKNKRNRDTMKVSKVFKKN
jgi:hypothetical protein